jgi:phosphoribosylglycinamide formyltransferase-1
MLVNRKGFFETEASLEELKLHNISLVVLAGFLWMIPGYLIKAFPGRIINIHPALLPKYGGKGMYGGNVHKAVIEAGEKESGITVHYVDEHYDNGDIIFQAKCEVKETDTPASLAERIHSLEHAHFPMVIESLLNA